MPLEVPLRRRRPANCWTSRAGDVVPIAHEGQIIQARTGELRTVSNPLPSAAEKSSAKAPVNDHDDVALSIIFDDSHQSWLQILGAELSREPSARRGSVFLRPETGDSPARRQDSGASAGDPPSPSPFDAATLYSLDPEEIASSA